MQGNLFNPNVFNRPILDMRTFDIPMAHHHIVFLKKKVPGYFIDDRLELSHRNHLLLMIHDNYTTKTCPKWIVKSYGEILFPVRMMNNEPSQNYVITEKRHKQCGWKIEQQMILLLADRIRYRGEETISAIIDNYILEYEVEARDKHALYEAATYSIGKQVSDVDLGGNPYLSTQSES